MQNRLFAIETQLKNLSNEVAELAKGLQPTDNDRYQVLCRIMDLIAEHYNDIDTIKIWTKSGNRKQKFVQFVNQIESEFDLVRCSLWDVSESEVSREDICEYVIADVDAKISKEPSDVPFGYLYETSIGTYLFYKERPLIISNGWTETIVYDHPNPKLVGCITVQECDVIPIVHPEHGMGYFFGGNRPIAMDR